MPTPCCGPPLLWLCRSAGSQRHLPSSARGAQAAPAPATATGAPLRWPPPPPTEPGLARPQRAARFRAPSAELPAARRAARHRLFSSAHFNDTFPQHTPPEILNTALEGVVLSMKALGVDKVSKGGPRLGRGWVVWAGEWTEGWVSEW